MIKGVIKNIRPWVLLIGVFASEHTVGEKVHNVGYRSFLLRKDSELWIPNYGKISDKIDSMDKTLKELTNAILKLAEKSAK